MKKFLPLLMLFASVPAFAVRVTSLYTAELPVAAQTSEFRSQAVHDGFLQVLIRVSGNAEIDKNPAIKPFLRRADYYVQEYTYSTPTPDSSQYIIKISYNKNDINRLLHQAGVAYWGQNRPLLLVWLTDDKAGQSEIVDSDTADQLLGMTKLAANKYGLPLIFPVMDANEMQAVTPDDIENAKLPVLQTAANRYSPDGLLIGTLKHEDNKVIGHLKLVLGSQEWEWNLTNLSSEEVIDSLMDQVNQALTNRYMIKDQNAQPNLIRLHVNHIARQEDLHALTNYLEGLGPVRQVDLSEVTGDAVELSVSIQGSVDAFVQNATIGQHLVLKAEDTAKNKLFYDWKQ